jgi:transcriptional regulator with XRE-family HTH domain
MEITKTVALNVRRLRDGQKLTREALAKAANVSAQTIYDIENENKKPSLLVVESLAKALSIKPSTLLESDELAPIVNLPVSKTIQKLMAIPDKVYDFAQDEAINDEVWEIIEDIMEGAIEDRKLLKLPDLNKG